MSKEILHRLEDMETDLRATIQSRAVPDVALPGLRTALAGIQHALRELVRLGGDVARKEAFERKLGITPISEQVSTWEDS